MREATVFMMPKQLRRLFVRIIIHCNPTHPKELWEEFKNVMTEDFMRHFNKNENYAKSIDDIVSVFAVEGKNVYEYPQVRELLQFANDISFDIDHNENLENYLVLGNEFLGLLNEKQKEISHRVLSVASNAESNDIDNNSFYIDGPGGSGN